MILDLAIKFRGFYAVTLHVDCAIYKYCHVYE
jgi:hypothetical protein